MNIKRRIKGVTSNVLRVTHSLCSVQASKQSIVTSYQLLVSSCLLLVTGYLSLVTDLQASDVRAKLNGTANTNQFQIRDSNDAVVGWVDAQGNAVFTGSVTIKGSALRAGEGVGGGDAIQIRSGGDLKIFESGNSGSAILYSDRNNELTTTNLVLTGTAAITGGTGTTYSLTTSSGINVQAGLLNLGGSFVGDKKIGNRNLVITSSTSYSAAATNIDSGSDYADVQLPQMSHTYSIPSGLGNVMIVVGFSCWAYSSGCGANGDEVRFRIKFGGTTEITQQASAGNSITAPISMNFAKIVSSGADYTITVTGAEEWSACTYTSVDRSLVTYWFPVP